MYKILGADQKEYGPVSAEQLRQWIAEGRANAQTKVLPVGATEWKPLAELPEFAGALNKTPGPPSLSLPPPSHPATNSLAIAGLITGILSLIPCCCFGVLFGVAGLICSGIALSQIKRDPNQGGKPMAVAGLVLSILGILLFFALLMFGMVSGGLDQILRELKK
jgi:hypothetical protein